MNGTDVMTGKMTFSNLRTDQRENAVKNTTIASQTAPRTKNKLTAMRDGNDAPGPPKAHEVCLCETRTVDGKKWLMKQADCPDHGISKFNLAFERKGGAVEGAGRDGRKKAHSY